MRAHSVGAERAADPARVLEVEGEVERLRREIAESLVHLARGWDLDLVAEGVETAEQGALVAAIGVGQAQGRHFAPPMTADAVACATRAAAVRSA